MNVLVFAPHNDDEVLGVGGTIAKFSKQGHNVFVCELTSGENAKTLQKEALKAHEILGVKKSYFLNLPVNKLRDMNQTLINKELTNIIKLVKPEIAFIPHHGDMHVDHEETAKAAMVALRPVSCNTIKAIYAYETLSETGWNIPDTHYSFIPNVWVDISDTIDLKIQAMSAFKSQLQQFPSPRSLESIQCLSKFRGTTMCIENAESFILIRQKIGDDFNAI